MASLCGEEELLHLVNGRRKWGDGAVGVMEIEEEEEVDIFRNRLAVNLGRTIRIHTAQASRRPLQHIPRTVLRTLVLVLDTLYIAPTISIPQVRIGCHCSRVLPLLLPHPPRPPHALLLILRTGIVQNEVQMTVKVDIVALRSCTV